VTGGGVPEKPDDVFQFPCPFPLKIIGRAGELFIPTTVNLLEGVVGPVAKESISSRLSRDGKYLSMTVTFTAHSREQLEAAYAAVQKNPDVVMVL